MLRVCYHIQSHRDPAQILRLVRRVRALSPSSIILLSHQVGGEPLDLPALHAVGGVHVFPTSGGYGDFSHLDRYLESARWLLANDEPFDWFLNLSGQDYPIVDLANAERELSGVREAALMEIFPVFGETSHWTQRRALLRYGYRHRRVGTPSPKWHRRARYLAAINWTQPWLRFSPAYASIGTRAAMPFTSDFVCYGGSFFANLSRRAVEELLDFCDTRHDFVSWARGVVAPEEIFLQTILGNAADIEIRDECKRYFDFSQSRANHPKVLTEEDLPRMLESGAWFARKFAADAPVLDVLDGLLDEQAAV